MPCLAYLSQLREAYPEIEAMGAGVVAVATGAGYQAQHLMQSGTPFPCLVDPDRRLYRALGLAHIPWYRFLSPSTWSRYLGSLGEATPGRITGDPLQAPGVAVLGTDRRLAYLHRGRTLGDYPPLREVLDAAEEEVSDEATRCLRPPGPPGPGPGPPGS
ncbi:MAG: AhpC/TSA family protein [Acidimicrobiales bacterium]